MKQDNIFFFIMMFIPIVLIVTMNNYMTPFPFSIPNLLFIIAFIIMGVFLGFVIFSPKEKIKESMK